MRDKYNCPNCRYKNIMRIHNEPNCCCYECSATNKQLYVCVNSDHCGHFYCETCLLTLK